MAGVVAVAEVVCAAGVAAGGARGRRRAAAVRSTAAAAVVHASAVCGGGGGLCRFLRHGRVDASARRLRDGRKRGGGVGVCPSPVVEVERVDVGYVQIPILRSERRFARVRTQTAAARLAQVAEALALHQSARGPVAIRGPSQRLLFQGWAVAADFSHRASVKRPDAVHRLIRRQALAHVARRGLPRQSLARPEAAELGRRGAQRRPGAKARRCSAERRPLGVRALRLVAAHADVEAGDLARR
mmetsp:Transcript_6619/g.23647  ORF Transcript_6619/g.23647 Transcript_6619/m.23647 type:complete len:243 (-) Transcript_6619:841-1569(-)